MAELGINSFLANFQGGGLRPNLYKVILTFPAAVGGAQASFKASFSCKATEIPASQLGVAEAWYMGRPAKFAGDRTFDDWNITVLLDNDMIVRDAFEAWSDSINANEGNIAIPGWGNPSNYMAQGKVVLIDREGNEGKTYTIESCWPTNVGVVQLAWDQQNQIAEMPVTMAVNWWKSDNTH